MSQKIVIETRHKASANGRSVNEIGEEYFEFILQNDPLYATFIGDHRYDNLLPDLRPFRRTKDYERLDAFKAELEAINPAILSDIDLVRYDLLRQEITSLLGVYDCQFPLWMVDHLDGPHSALMELSHNHTVRDTKDVHNLFDRFRQSHTYLHDHIANLRDGRSRGLIAPKVPIEHVIEQLDSQLAQDPQASPFMLSAEKLPSTLSKKQKADIATELLTIINDVVYPALRGYRDYLRYELLPDARDVVGIHALVGGKQCYKKLIERHTGLKKSPQEIHVEGLQEVDRIKNEMRALIRANTDLSDERAYAEHLLRDPLQYLASDEALVQHNKDLVSRATASLPRAFGKLPKTKIEVMPMEDYRQKHAPAAYYYEAPSDGMRPALYYLNTYEPEKRPLYNMAALAFHEAVPGHHLQIALANENSQIPRFQRHLGQTAFVEGWALYAELLARELGLYQSVEELFGSLNYELWRALRLVVDTGIHFHGWSREKAMAYLANNSALSKAEIVNEIDRYIVWPGQALAYKIGQMEFVKLRTMSEAHLSDRFSLPNFHDQMLRHGAVPLATLRNATTRWLQTHVEAKR